jgi:hypothetical protein
LIQNTKAGLLPRFFFAQPGKQLSTKITKNTKKFKGLHLANEHPMGESPSQCNLLFYSVPFVFFVDELPFLDSRVLRVFGSDISRFNLKSI